MFTIIETIPHTSQRYPTVGDWQFGSTLTIGGSLALRIKVSDLNNPDYEFLIGLHELIEAYLCHRAGISERDVDRFDRQFEESGPSVAFGDTGEPGDDPAAPYHRQHVFASAIERLMAHELGIDWTAYSATLDALP
jgi:hypothetical protein